MEFAPRQNWAIYEARTRDHDASSVRRVPAADVFNIYEDFYRTITHSDRDRGDTARLEAHRWREKLAFRKKMVMAFQALDGQRLGDTPSNNTR